jgi:hypothetical protein
MNWYTLTNSKKYTLLFFCFHLKITIFFAQTNNQTTQPISNELTIQVIAPPDTVNSKPIASNELNIQVVAAETPILKTAQIIDNQLNTVNQNNTISPTPPKLLVVSDARQPKTPLSSKQAKAENELKNCEQLSISYWNLAEQRRFDIHKLQDTISSLRVRVAGLLEEKEKIFAKNSYFQQQYSIIDSIKQGYAVKYKDTLIQYSIAKQYLKSTQNELTDVKTKLATISKENDKLREQLRNKDKAAEQWQRRSNYWREYTLKTFPYQSTIFVAFNYKIPLNNNLENNNNSLLAKTSISIIGFPYLKLAKWTTNGRASGIYFSGFSFGNWEKMNHELPNNDLRGISTATVERVTQKLRSENKVFTPLTFRQKQGNYTKLSADVIFHLKKTPFYAKIGGSYQSGSQWRMFEGNLLDELPKTMDNAYIVDFQEVKNFKPYFAVAVVQRYVQGEIGFDTRQSNFYFNVGFNLPINKYFFYQDKGSKKMEEFYKEDTVIEH